MAVLSEVFGHYPRGEHAAATADYYYLNTVVVTNASTGQVDAYECVFPYKNASGVVQYVPANTAITSTTHWRKIAGGAKGATGATGAAGTNGTNGATGATGATGAAGTNGTNGAAGATGATGAGFNGVTSSSSNTPASSGNKTVVVNNNGAFTVGRRVRIENTATNFFEGIITAISTLTWTIACDYSVGTTAATAWTIELAPVRIVAANGLLTTYSE